MVVRLRYNSRLQVSSLAAVQGSTLLSLGYSYGVSSSQNNGSPSGETIARPGFSASQSYAYDGANRLTSASEAGGWNQSYVFDTVGNRAVNSGYIPATTFTPQTSGSTVPYDTRNHWVAANYDAAGNMTSVSTQSMTYDAEGRLLTLLDGTTVNDSFTYDGDGKRVTKTSNSVLTTYVYDPNGQLAMEVGGASPAVSGTMYVTRDRLGSTRLTTNASGAVGCHDYLPFGEEIPGAVSGWGRTSVTCYAQTPETDVKFTGQLFDAETGLAYFNARYLRASMGSFVTADPAGNFVADSGHPQSWHMNSYAWNNPLAFVDPSGLDNTCSLANSGDDGGTITLNCADDGTEGGSEGGSSGETITGSLQWLCNYSNMLCYSSLTAIDTVASNPSQAPVSGGPTIQAWRRGSGQSSGACFTEALKKNALSLGLDAIGLIPEGGVIASAFSLWHGAAAVSNGTKVVQAAKVAGGIVAVGYGSQDPSGWGAASAATGVAGIAVAFAPQVAKALPGIGQLVALGSAAVDLAHVWKDYSDCNN